MTQEFELRMDGETVGKITLEVGPMGMSMSVEGEVEIKQLPQAPKPRYHDTFTIHTLERLEDAQDY